MHEQAQFEEWSIAEVAAKLPHVDSFRTLIDILPGIFPTQVLSALHSLRHGVASVAEKANHLILSARNEVVVSPPPSGLLGLPPPHPLDFEWRFAPSAITAINAKLRDLTPASSRVALVAVPTFASTPQSLEGHSVDYYGGDANEVGLRTGSLPLRLRVFTDLLKSPKIFDRYAAVLMDPPWYKEHISRFLHFASDSLFTGGHLLLAMPALGTRSSVLQENHETEVLAKHLGFVIEDKVISALPYETPPFERNALRAAGIANVGQEWRRGDLWILRKEWDINVPWPGDVMGSTWKEIRFGPVRIRVDLSKPDAGDDPNLVHLLPGDVLPSVSRGDPRRSAAGVWTSGNRIFGCEAPNALLKLLIKAAENATIRLSSVERQLIEHVRQIIEQERRELQWPAG